MLDFRKKAIGGAVRLFHAVRMVVVACVCLLIGVSARHLIDAYGPEMISALKKDRLNTEGPGHPVQQQDLSVRLEPVEPHWN